MQSVSELHLLLDLTAQSLAGEALSLKKSLNEGPVIVMIGLPHVHASRLVVGYLRRLKENHAKAQIWIVLQGELEAVKRYSEGYLGSLVVIHDGDLKLSEAHRSSHIPSTYLYELKGEKASVSYSFSGFKREAMNKLASTVANVLGDKAKELISTTDNKGEYELAERGLWSA
ncbi:MAG: hypothetical protein R2880_02825 [Deinococcales bacterium]